MCYIGTGNMFLVLPGCELVQADESTQMQWIRKYRVQ